MFVQFVINYLTIVLLFDAYVGYHTCKITLPVMPLMVPVTLPIPVMSAACTGTVRPFILGLSANPLRYVPIQSTSTVIAM
jgi:hypothetical protein